jgi:predicted DNA-binding transcriptional regulator YafY
LAREEARKQGSALGWIESKPAGLMNDTKKPGPKKPGNAGRRLLDAEKLLCRASGATIKELMTELEIKRSSAFNYLDELRTHGHEIEAIGERDGQRVHRVVQAPKTRDVAFTLEELFGHIVVGGFAAGFEGTGIDEAHRRTSTKMDVTLKPKDRARSLALKKKVLDIPDHVHDYSDKGEVIDQIVTALVDEQPLVIKYENRAGKRRRLRVDPLTLVTYKRGLYLVGFSHHHKALRVFAIDGIEDATRQQGKSFVYPTDYDPRKLFDGAFGIIGGEETEVTIRFDGSVEPSLRRRKFHATQRLQKKGGYVYLTMRPRGTTEVLPWVLSWGANAAVVSPPSLRNEWLKHAEAIVRAAQHLTASDERALGDDDADDPGTE